METAEAKTNMTDGLINIRIEKKTPLPSPETIMSEVPITAKAKATVLWSRNFIDQIIKKKKKLLMIITGPCSIHSEAVALDYATKIANLIKSYPKL